MLATSDGAQYVHGLDLVAEYRDGEWSYPLGDALGSVRQWTDEGGFITYRGDYTPFGVALSSEGSTESAWGYTGEWKDASLGAVYLRARWYQPAVGRLISADTIVPEPGDPQSLNRYTYVRNNPVGYLDPSGHSREPPDPRIEYDQYFPAPPIAVVYGGSPGRSVNLNEETLSTILNSVGLSFDIAEIHIAIVGTAQQGVFTLGGVEAGGLVGIITGRDPGPAVEAASLAGGASTGAAAGTIVSMPADIFEDIVSYFGIGLDISADLIGGSTYLDSETNEWVIGQDTCLAITSQFVDQLIPGSAADLALSGGGSVYDLSMMLPKATGRLEFRVARDDWTNNYLVIYADAVSDTE